MKQSKYGFRQYGFKVGMNNFILSSTMKLLGIDGFHVEYKKDPEPFIVITEESHPKIWKQLNKERT
jgi:hypothetical protein